MYIYYKKKTTTEIESRTKEIMNTQLFMIRMRFVLIRCDGEKKKILRFAVDLKINPI